MADKKVSELDAITGANTAADDLFLIVDSSGSVTKKITRAELNNAIEQDVLSTVDINGGTIDSTVIGGTTPAAGDFTTLGATGNITVGGTVDGRDVAADGTKLDGIEASATADQTDAEIRAAVEAASDSNVFTDADHTKLNGIATSATANPNAIDNVVEDTTPQLGGALDVNSNSITSASNGDVTIDPNGTGDIVLDAKVGISTTSPESALQVTGTVNTTPDSAGVHLGMDSNYATIELAGSDGGQLDFPNASNTDYRGRIRYTGSDNKMAFFAGGAGTQTMTVTNTSVGIGTASPSRKLELNSGGTGALVTFTDGVATNFTFKTDGSSVGTFGTEAGSTQLALMVANTEAARFDGSRNFLVGKTSSNIGTAGSEVTPTYISATRADNSPLFLNRTNSDGSIITFRKDNSTVGSIGSNGSLLYIALREDGSNPVALAGSGSDTGAVVPATTSGAERDNAINLGKSTNRFKDGYFSGSVYTTYLKGNGGHTGQVHFTGSHDIRFVTNGNEAARFEASGHLQIGQTSSTTPGSGGNTTAGSTLRSVGDAYFSRNGDIALYLSRNGSDGKIASFARGGGEVGSISVASSSTTYNTSSDRRLKSNIQDAASASDKIDAIQVRQFDWNADDSHQDYGLIAQELQPIEPLAVTGDADSDEMMGVDYSKLVPMLIKEIQELRGRVAALEAN